MIADYWIIRRAVLDLADLYRPGGRYWYRSGWNWRAVVAVAAGGVLAVDGSQSARQGAPSPPTG